MVFQLMAVNKDCVDDGRGIAPVIVSRGKQRNVLTKLRDTTVLRAFSIASCTCCCDAFAGSGLRV